ncbi:YueI family protein [Rossellomorea aquimaris]|nr:YueI family protein [Rossellomorea aquimaris]
MSKPTIDDYLENGMYGQKQTKPDERRKFLGSLRERIIIALTQSQVREKKVYQEVAECIKEHRGAKLLLNGNMNYNYLTKYIKLANQYGVKFSMVTNKESQTDIGLLLAYDHAINKEEIYVTKQADKPAVSTKPKKKSVFSKIKNKLF